MSAPLSLEEVSDHLLAAQSILNPALVEPITHARALMLLSRPIASVMLGDEEAAVLEFYGLYWVLEVDGTRTGFFDSEDDAVRYLQSQMSVTGEGGQHDE